MNKKTLKILVYISILTLGIFTILFLKKLSSGGDLTIEEFTTQDYFLVGVEFNGSANKQAFKDAFEQIDTKKTNDALPTFMVHYEMDEPSKKNKFHVNTFIGYAVKDTSKALKGNYEYRILHARKIVRAASVSNPVFQGRIYPEMERYFSKHQLAVDSSYIVEKYWKNNKIEIEMGIE